MAKAGQFASRTLLVRGRAGQRGWLVKPSSVLGFMFPSFSAFLLLVNEAVFCLRFEPFIVLRIELRVSYMPGRWSTMESPGSHSCQHLFSAIS